MYKNTKLLDSIHLGKVGGESTHPHGGITSPEANGKPLEKVPDGLRRRAAEALALEVANVLEGRDGFGAPSPAPSDSTTSGMKVMPSE